MQHIAPPKSAAYFISLSLSLFLVSVSVLVLVYIFPSVAIQQKHVFCLPNQDSVDVSQQRGFDYYSPAQQLELHPPVFTPKEDGRSEQDGCVYTMTLMEHTFANSYGRPFVGSYSPPPCPFNTVHINFTVSVRGRQFDRLGIFYLSDVEILRTSTSEPGWDGVRWSYVKDVSPYLALWRQKQKLIFDLPNIVNDVYTGPLHTRLTATFFSQNSSRMAQAGEIMPISAGRSEQGKGSAFTVPNDKAASSYRFGQNIDRAVVSLSACGQQAEEFWYTNVLSGDTTVFGNKTGALGGYSPFREVQLLIDGYLAGVSWPFPVIFTGGIAPGFWRPVVGINAYDLGQQEIDITPWLKYLSDGAEHTFEIKVVGLHDSGDSLPRQARLSDHVGGYWVVSGTIFVFRGDDSVQPGEALLPKVVAPKPTIEVFSHTTQDSAGQNETLSYNVLVSRRLSITSGDNSTSWNQSINFVSANQLTSYGLTQHTVHLTVGTDVAFSPSHSYSFLYSYPLSMNSTIDLYPEDEGFGITAWLSRGLNGQIAGSPVFPTGLQNMSLIKDWSPGEPQLVQERGLEKILQVFSEREDDEVLAFLGVQQDGNASYRAGKDNSYSTGALKTDLRFGAGNEGTIEAYERKTLAVDGKMASDVEKMEGWNDDEKVTLANKSAGRGLDAAAMPPKQSEHPDPAARNSARALLGRGPEVLESGHDRHRYPTMNDGEL